MTSNKVHVHPHVYTTKGFFKHVSLMKQLFGLFPCTAFLEKYMVVGFFQRVCPILWFTKHTSFKKQEHLFIQYK